MRNGGHGIALALAAAAMITSLGGDPIYAEAKRRQERDPSPRPISPNDHGPVVDTTRESKRARRRRLAKAKGSDHG